MSDVFAAGACHECGGDVRIYTDAPQDPTDGYEWWAWDGDEARCEECGTKHQVVADENTDRAYLEVIDE